MTELDAVNLCLKRIGETPVNSVDNDGVSEASQAYDTLVYISRSVQELQLNCNTEEEYPLTPGPDGRVEIPTNVLFVDPSDPTEDYVQRGNYFYDRDKHTFVINRTVPVDITFFLPFEELPSYVRTYIALRSAREFQLEVLGSDFIDAKMGDLEARSWATLSDKEIQVGDHNILGGPDISYALRRTSR
jgi:hypothetical protein